MRSATGTRPPLHMRVAEALEKEINRAGPRRLPGIRPLSERFGVAYVTVAKALRTLERRGLLALSQGRAAKVLKPLPVGAEAAAPESSAARLAQRIQARIGDGHYRVGQVLPKYPFFTLAERVSSATVAAAHALLAGRGAIHKRGRSWVAGPAPARYANRVHAHHRGPASPTVLVLVPGSQQARDDLNSEHLRPFMVEFLSQLSRAGIRCALVQAERGPAAEPVFASGKREIASLVQACGERYLGALIPEQLDHFRDIRDWIEWLSRFGKPVVWFDYADTGGALDRRAIPRRGFYRACCPERGLADLAISVCAGLGHRKLGIPQYPPYLGGRCQWFQARKSRLEAAARQWPGGLSLAYTRHDEPFWRARDAEYASPSGCRRGTPMRLHLEALAAAHPYPGKEAHALGKPLPARLRREMFASVPSLARLIRDRQVTALLAPNQWLAVNYFEWLQAAGVAIPGHLSLLAFDDYYHQSFYPITVVDHNFGELGYKCAHALIGDIAIAADRSGAITSAPHLVERGSLGPPAREGRVRSAIPLRPGIPGREWWEPLS